MRPVNRSGRRRALISLTPLIDVVFILLVFFMLASSFLDWRSIQLSAPATAAMDSTLDGALLVEIRRGGLRLSGKKISLHGLVKRLSERLAQKPHQRVIIKPDDRVSLQDVVSVLDRLAEAGINDMSLIRDTIR
ncbi:MAG: biopolymer transporter ExbD [Alphaproteobacteria bacterium]|nr:MAG: biopolymer transporter ExbD [Alphaproteobacteria bacterium]